MSYRDETDALRARLEMAEADRDAHRRQAEAARLELQQAVAGVPTPESLKHDPWMTSTKVFLWIQFAGWLLFVVVTIPSYILIAHEDPPFGRAMDPIIQGLLMAAMVNAFFAPVGIGSAVGAVGLQRGRLWGWWAAIVAFGFSCLCGCVPIGVIGFILLMRAQVRTAYFGVGSRHAPLLHEHRPVQ